MALHTKLSGQYSTCEPHFRPENVAHVEEKLLKVVEVAGHDLLQRALPLSRNLFKYIGFVATK